MSEIEFLDPAPDDDEVIGGDERPRPRLRVPRGLAVAGAPLWLAAAGLAVGASFATVYQAHIVDDPLRTVNRVDGWGRYAGDLKLLGGHGTRFGIVLVAGAAVLVVAGLLAATALLRGWSGPRIAPVLGAVGLGAALAMTATMYLDVSTARATLTAPPPDFGTDPGSVTVVAFAPVHVTAGSAIWLGAAASGCALVALACSARSVAVAGDHLTAAQPTAA